MRIAEVHTTGLTVRREVDRSGTRFFSRVPGWLLILPLVMINGCTAVPEREAADLAGTIPVHWTGTNQPSVPAFEHWVDSFADPVLSVLVRESLAGNYDLKAAAARVDAAREQARIDGAGRWPQLAFAPGYERAQVRSAGFGSTESGAFEALLDLHWELDVWGRIRDFQEATLREADAAAADFHAARLSLAARTAQSYFELAEAKLQTEVAGQSIRDRRILVELVRGRFARGLTRGLDLSLALTDLNIAEALLATTRNRVQSITRRLEVLLGRYSSAGLTAPRLPDPPRSLSAGLPSELLERRPDLIAAFERRRSADARVQSARKATLPRITLTASGGTRSAALTELADPRAIAWNLAMGLVQPLFTGGRIEGEISVGEARVNEALNIYKDTMLNAFREVEQTLAAEEWLREQEHALREAVEQTDLSQKLAVYAYRQGFTQILTLLDSYRSTLDARSAHLALKRQFSIIGSTCIWLWVERSDFMHSGRRAKSLKIILPVLILSGFIAGTAILIGGKAEIASKPVKREPPTVEVMTAEPRALQLNVHSQGVVSPRTDIDLVSEVAGKVIDIHPAFAAGGFFKKGETLVRIDPRDYEFAVVRAAAQIAEARKELLREQAEAEQAEQEWQALGSGEASSYALHKPHLEERRAKLAAAQAGLGEAQLNRERCVLRVPFPGRIRNKQVDIGQVVTTGAALTRLYATDAVEVRLPVPGDQFEFLNWPLYVSGAANGGRPQPKVKLSARFGRNSNEWDATLVRAEAALDEKTGMFYVIARLPEPYSHPKQGPPLAVGQFVHAKIEGIARDHLVKIASTALRSGYQVYIVDENSRLRLRTVEVLRREEDGMVVSGGLDPGDVVMVAGVELPVEGMRVTPKPHDGNREAMASEQTASP
ncbi:MAG: efflux transporter outer membrane subunit [Methylococcales bacterium]